MPQAGFSLQVHRVDAETSARRCTFHTPRGAVEMPAFMPVGTQGTVKGLTIDNLRQTGAQMVLGNAYHLALRPGADVVRDLEGLHRFMGWEGPILTDSGGFQLYSLAQTTKVTEEGVTFRSHIDGALVELTPERAVQIQQQLGTDVAMVLDHVVALPNDEATIADANARSIRWAARCRAVPPRADQALFAIVQGGLDPTQRTHSAQALAEMDFDGYAVGGLSVGETHEEMVRTLEITVPLLPAKLPRYLMGVGRPQDMLAAIANGIDLFDCVMPTRNGRNALAFTNRGTVRLRNLCHQRDEQPLEENCPCAACRHSRGYLRHLFMAREMLGPILVSIHNLTYYQRLMSEARAALQRGTYREFWQQKKAGWAEDSSG